MFDKIVTILQISYYKVRIVFENAHKMTCIQKTIEL